MRAGGVLVEAPARLHLGFLDMNGGLGRRFGSIGLTLDGIATRLRLHADPDPGEPAGPEAQRIARLQGLLSAELGLAPARVAVEALIPSHVGLGSGTQLGLALGVGQARLAGLALEAPAIGRILERGARSGIGIAAFGHGGLVTDGGKGAGDAPPPILSRLPFPAAWRVLLVLDQARQGLSGEAERAAFRALPIFPAEIAAHLCRLVLLRFLPGIAEADIAAAGSAIGEIQRLVGDHFAPVQEGRRFVSPGVTEALAWLEAEGIQGVGQSSWGPTGFALIGDAEDGERLMTALAARLAPHFPTLHLRLVAGRNHGARIVPLDAQE